MDFIIADKVNSVQDVKKLMLSKLMCELILECQIAESNYNLNNYRKKMILKKKNTTPGKNFGIQKLKGY